jgi:hypothetical protein
MPPGVLLVRLHIILMFILLTLPPKSDMPLKMMQVAIHCAICTPCCEYWFATPEVTICTEKFVIPTISGGMMFNGEFWEEPPEDFVQHPLDHLPIPIQSHLRNIAFGDRNR